MDDLPAPKPCALLLPHWPHLWSWVVPKTLAVYECPGIEPPDPTEDGT